VAETVWEGSFEAVPVVDLASVASSVVSPAEGSAAREVCHIAIASEETDFAEHSGLVPMGGRKGHYPLVEVDILTAPADHQDPFLVDTLAALGVVQNRSEDILEVHCEGEVLHSLKASSLVLLTDSEECCAQRLSI